MKKLLFLVLAAILISSLAACGGSVSAGELKSDKPRETAPAVNPADMTSLVNGNTAFAFTLYQALKSSDKNFFYSPHSISEALAMTYGGARGTTEKQMADTLHFILGQSQLHPAFNKLDQELAKRGQGAQGKDDKGFRLNVVNAIWGQQDYKFISEYLDLLAQNYGAGLRVLDFVKSPEPSRQTINQWVSDQTEQRIKDLLPQGSINSLTRLVLTNAIYFNASWLNRFEKSATSSGAFHLLSGNDVNVPMMKQNKTYAYASGDNYQAVEIPYDGRELSMVILLPKSGQFSTFESALTGPQVQTIIQSLKSQSVNLTMPKFKFDSQFGLKPVLAAMGMPVAFTDAADFSGMNGRRDLMISDVIHKAFVSVDEDGTEAAAATAVIMTATAMPAQPVEVTLDRPFIFLIRDIQTGAVLFVGRVINPAE
jgi:serpin B